MKFIKKFLKIVLLLLVLLAIGGWLYTKTLHPVYKGQIKLKQISDEVTVYFDAMGVPHINANNQKDAYTALGYVHAQDRLWQMELIRRISAGRLSELFGKELLRTDRFFSGLGIEEASEKTILNLDKSSDAYQLTMAYLNGINQFIAEGKSPIEFTLLGIKKEKYTVKDVYNVFGYMAFSFAVAHRTDPLLTEIKEKLGQAYFDELNEATNKNLTLNKSYKQIDTTLNEINRQIDTTSVLKADFSKAIGKIIDKLPVSTFIGSNSWVIGAEKTKKGKVIFANDPHIGFSQPSVWYQSHITTPTYEMYGFNLALTPFPLLGHNRNYAYGLTMFENDDVDFYYEKNNPNTPLEYQTTNGFKKYALRDKQIKIKGHKDTVYQIKVSDHGPVMNGIIDNVKGDRPIAMQWIYTKLENQLLEVSYEMAHANSLGDFKNGAKKLHAPGLNIMYGDAKDNIAWFASAKLYKYRAGLNTKLILDGTSGNDEIVSYLDFEENPQAINPDWHYVYSANNQPDSISNMLYPGYYLPEDRARRIVNLLEEKSNFTKEDVAKMLYDATSATTSEIVAKLADGILFSELTPSEKKALVVLKKWTGYYGKQEVGPTIYNRMLFEVLNNTYKDEMGSAFNRFINTPLQDKFLAAQVGNEKSIWWDDVTTKDKTEKRQETLTKSFKQAVVFLNNQLGENLEDWKWNRVISVEHEHAIGKAGGLLRKFFNVGQFETVGGNGVINNQIFKIDSSGYYKVHAGPSTRRVIDFSDVENGLAILPTGQSGNPFSAHYKDQAGKYLNGEFVKTMINQEEIKQSNNVLVFMPGK